MKPVILASIAIHIVFGIQVLVAVNQGGLMLPTFAGVFYPQSLLMFFLPPAYPIEAGHVSYFGVIGKILVAYPASLLYAAIIVGLVIGARRLVK